MSYHYQHYNLNVRPEGYQLWLRVLTFLTTSLLLCCCLVSLSVHAGSKEEEGECHAKNAGNGNGGGSCNAINLTQGEGEDYICGLYLAESKIPNTGWGLFAGAKGYRVGDQFLYDVAVVVPEAVKGGGDNLPRWKLLDYVWGAYETSSYFDTTDHHDPVILPVSVLPGLGSLANSHTRLFNAQTSCHSIELHSILRSNASAGAFSHCQNHYFSATHDIPPGHEIFTEYGDKWFEERYPDQPRRADYEVVDEILNAFKQLLQQHQSSISEDTASDIWEVVASTATHMNERIQAIMPQTHDVAIAGASHPMGLAGATSTYSQSIEWLDQNGMCLDHLQAKPSEHVPYQNGAFVKRTFQKGERVTPVPVVPISRKHLLTRGHSKQLLLNYCYGHPESTLLLFPYGPVVNLINHAGGINHTSSTDMKANVALRWSTLNVKDNFQRSVDEILTLSGTTFLLELYALRDLKVGEEVLLDYGQSFETAWKRHEREWKVSPPIHSNDYRPPSDFNKLELLYTKEDGDKYPPSHIQPRCLVAIAATRHLEKDEDGWYPFVRAAQDGLDWTTCCDVLSTTDNHETYRVILYKYSGLHVQAEQPIRVKNVPRDAITFIDKPYQGHQFLQRAFRHEIHVPNELYPEAWKDQPWVMPSCQLYMAETSIPNSTAMGVYTAQPIARGDRISFGDVGLPVIDFQRNNLLRHLQHHSHSKAETTEHAWLLDAYYHRSGPVAFEAHDAQSIIPGLGMLANSNHCQVPVNAMVVEPIQTTPLHRAYDAGAGGSSYYHGAHTSAIRDLKAGEELFFESVGKARYGNAPKTVSTERGTTSEARFRSVEWLESNGRCLDNIRPGDSTIFQAGYGAFATRKILQGAVISPMPVVPLLRRDFQVYEMDENKHGVTRIHLRGQQLLINYCYGHPGSSMVFFPYSPVVNYVNHNSTPNAKLQWSSLSRHDKHWQRSPVELTKEANAGLIMELVALRDINPSEEVFLDYGNIWVKKWQEFEKAWHPVEDETAYLPAWRLNNRMEWLRTEDELKTDPYPYKNVWTACAVASARRLERGSTEMIRWFDAGGLLDNISNFHPCDILERETLGADLTEVMDRRESISPMDVYYKVRVHEADDTTSSFSFVPRKAIRFFDRAYSTDLFLHQAFRHEIQLPDEMVSEAWRDLH